MSIAEEQRREWMRKHKAIVSQFRRQLTRRPPYTYDTVYGVDWISKNGDWISGMADWGMPTQKQAIDKAMISEAKRLPKS